MPQGDDFVTTNDTPAPEPVDLTPPAADTPEVPDPAASAPVDPTDPTPEPTAPPVETPEQKQAKSDRAFAAMRRANEAQAARLAALEARVAPAPAPVPPPAPDAAPQPDAYPTHAAYVQAVAEWAVEQGERTREAKAAATQIHTDWEQQEAKTKTVHPDYDEVLQSDTTPYHPAVLQAIQTSELGSEVAYYLASHAEDAARISALPPAAAIRAIGRLEARLEGSSAPTTPPTPSPTPTPLPRPLTPVGGTGTAGSTVSPDQMSYEDYSAWYKKTYGTR